MRHTTRAPGFTLIELMISVSSLGIAILGLMGVLSYGVVAGGYANDFSKANQLGREIVEYIRVEQTWAFNPYPPGLIDGDDEARTAINAPPLNDPHLHQLPNTTIFTRNIQVSYLDANLARLQVRVFWTVDGAEKMVETVALQRR